MDNAPRRVHGRRLEEVANRPDSGPSVNFMICHPPKRRSPAAYAMLQSPHASRVGGVVTVDGNRRGTGNPVTEALPNEVHRLLLVAGGDVHAEFQLAHRHRDAAEDGHRTQQNQYRMSDNTFRPVKAYAGHGLRLVAAPQTSNPQVERLAAD